MMEYKGNGDIVLLILNLYTRKMWVGNFGPRSLKPQGKTHFTH